MANDLYIGYMDEEVASILVRLMAKYPKRDFVVYERGLVTSDSAKLFERPMSDFSANRKSSFRYLEIEDLFKSKGKSGKYKDIKYEEYFRRRLRSRTDDAELIKFYSSIISEITLAPTEGSDGDPVFVIRAPEMGKQPGLTRIYLRLIIRYLAKVCAVTDMNVGCYGTGGGIVPGSQPGALQNITGSVFVGPDIDDKGRKFANVDFVYWDGKAFARKSQLAQSNYGPLDKQAEEIFYGNPMPLEIRSVLAATPSLESSVSATFSYFDGSDTKRAVDKTYNNLVTLTTKCSFKPKEGDAKSYEIQQLAPSPTPGKRDGTDYIINSNMEDYHLLRVLHSMSVDEFEREARNYPKLLKFLIFRVAANVVTSPEMEKLVESYIDKTMYTVGLSKAEYQALVDWGKEGLPLTKDKLAALPKVAYTWQDALGLQQGNPLLQQLLIFHFEGETPVLGYQDQGVNYCLEPFCVEIATDFRDTKSLVDVNKLWLRGGNKWIGIAKAMFLSEENIKDTQVKLKLPKNLDRVLYKSSGAPALQVQASAAVTEFTKKFG